MKKLFDNIYAGTPVLVTGHTGFKGSWLAAWLVELGAEVIGFSLDEPPTTPSNFNLTSLANAVMDVRGDILNLDVLVETIRTYKPEVIFHLAAQPIVLRAYVDPHLTFGVNTMGTINVLEAVRATKSVRALIGVTTDKVYQNNEWLWGYRENDQLGDVDPYGTSKAMAEMALAAYRQSYFAPINYNDHGVAVASARAGNVIGGGDFAAYRLIPDCMQALLAAEPIQIRNPGSVRPWQYVLEPLSGYLHLAAMLIQDGPAYAGAWNFGPKEQNGVAAQILVERLIELWGSGSWVHNQPYENPPETGYLRLNWEKAASRLQWQPVYHWEETLSQIVAWYQAYEQTADMYDVCRSQIIAYMEKAKSLGVGWAA